MIAPVLFLALVAAEAPDLSGTWRLDRSGIGVDSEAGFPGLVAAGAPETLHITHAANGSVLLESQINESHSRLYAPGVRTSTPVFVGQGGSLEMTSRWESEALVSEGRYETSSGASFEVKEVFTIEGGRLHVEVTIGGETTERTYTRIENVGPCESWPTHCKVPSR